MMGIMKNSKFLIFNYRKPSTNGIWEGIRTSKGYESDSIDIEDKQ